MTDDLVERVARKICCVEGQCYRPEKCFSWTFSGEARAAIAVALEEAAKVAEDEACHCEDTGSAPSDFGNAGRNDAALTIAAAIRALVKHD